MNKLIIKVLINKTLLPPHSCWRSFQTWTKEASNTETDFNDYRRKNKSCK